MAADTDETLRRILEQFAAIEFPAEMEVTKRLQDALKETDCNLGDRDSVLTMLITSIAQLEAELRAPKSRKLVIDLGKAGDSDGPLSPASV